MTTPTVPFDAPLAWSNYLSLDDDIKPYLNISKIEGREEALKAIAGMAQTMIQNFLKQPIAPTTFARRYNGWAGWMGDTVFLTYRPILGTPTVIEYWGANGVHPLTEQTPTVQTTADAFSLNRLTGQLTRVFVGMVPRPFFPGIRNLEITWTAGYENVPDDLKYATLELIRYHWVQGQELAGAPQKYKQDIDTSSSNMLYPGIPNRIGELLQNYKTVQIA